jgi:hypothetical protein
MQKENYNASQPGDPIAVNSPHRWMMDAGRQPLSRSDRQTGGIVEP